MANVGNARVAELEQRIAELEAELERSGTFVLLDRQPYGTWRLVSHHRSLAQARRASELHHERLGRPTHYGSFADALSAGLRFRT